MSAGLFGRQGIQKFNIAHDYLKAYSMTRDI